MIAATIASSGVVMYMLSGLPVTDAGVGIAAGMEKAKKTFAEQQLSTASPGNRWGFSLLAVVRDSHVKGLCN